jgi:hypothetical protein
MLRQMQRTDPASRAPAAVLTASTSAACTVLLCAAMPLLYNRWPACVHYCHLDQQHLVDACLTYRSGNSSVVSVQDIPGVVTFNGGRYVTQ